MKPLTSTTTKKLYIPLLLFSTRIVGGKLNCDMSRRINLSRATMVQNLFFSPQFITDFEWKDYALRIGSVLPSNKRDISEGLRYMSPESIRYRFLGSKKEFTEKELEYLTVLDGWNHYAIGILEQHDPKRGIAIIRLVRSSKNPQEAEIAITIIDDYQRKGLGTFLMNLMLLAARERDINLLTFTFLPQNEGIIHLIERLGPPVTKEFSHYYVQLSMDISELDIEAIKSRLVKTLPMIGTFHLKT